MNAHAALDNRGWINPDARRALAVAGAAAGRLTRLAAVAIYLAFLGAGITAWQFAKTPDKGSVAIIAFGALGAGMLWAMWLSRIAAVQVAGRSLRMPRIDVDVAWALAFGFVLTVLLPAVLASWAGTEPRIAYSAMVAGALLGTLVMLLPGVVMFGALTVFGWSVLVVTALPIEWDGIESLGIGEIVTTALPALALALALVVAWCWRRVLADPASVTGPMRRPAVLAFAGADSDSSTRPGQDQLPDWAWPSGQIEPQGPARPVRAMGAWLGTPFAPLSRSQLAIQWAAVALLVALVVAYQLRGDALSLVSMAMMTAGLAGGVVALVLQYVLRLDALRAKPAEWSELALLPGWGNAADARATLWRAVTRPITITVAGLLAVLLFIAVANGRGVFGVGLVVMAAIAVWAASVVACLRPLAGQRLGPVWMACLCLVGIGLPVLTVPVALSDLRAYTDGIGGFALVAAWCLGLAFLFVSGTSTWRRFRALPHPFVEARSRNAAAGFQGLRRGSMMTALLVLFAIGIAVGVGIGFFL